MSLNLSVPSKDDLKPRITVFGVGGAGGNAVNNMITQKLDGVEFVVANTDAQALSQSQATTRLQLGEKQTEGLGAGAKASVGAAAAEESIEHIIDHLAGAHMCFITAGMGGGTGTGAAPIIAQAARELGVLTIGVVTKPFQFEGARRMKQAESGIEELQKVVDTLIIIPNQNLFRLANERTTFTEAFAMADDVLYQGVKGVTDLMVRPGLINLDFADVRSVMDEMGKAMMGTGEHEGEDRALKAAQNAIENPLLDDTSLKGAKGVLINVTGGYDLTLFELDEAANRIREEVDPNANIIVGSTLDPEINGFMRVSVVATGIDAEQASSAAAVSTATRSSASATSSEASSSSQDAQSLDDISEPEAHSSDVPPPAYRPIDNAAASAFDDPNDMQDVNTPTAQELERIAGALSSRGGAAMGHETPAAPTTSPMMSNPVSAPVARPTATPQNASAHGESNPQNRFGFNNIINRLTASEDKSRPAVTAPQAPSASDKDQGEKSNVEVPSFLRRQAP